MHPLKFYFSIAFLIIVAIYYLVEAARAIKRAWDETGRNCP